MDELEPAFSHAELLLLLPSSGLRLTATPLPLPPPVPRGTRPPPCCISTTSHTASPAAAPVDQATVALPAGAQAGLVGRNGAGKTTLFRLIAGEIRRRRRDRAPRERPHRRCAQEAPAGREPLIDIVLAADDERAALLAEAETRDDAAPHRRDPRPPCRHRRPLGRGARRPRSWPASASTRRRSAALLGAIPAAGACASRSPASCSPQPDLLLLDEPTNYLDLEGAMWLESYLARYPHTVLDHQPRPRPPRTRGRRASSISTRASSRSTAAATTISSASGARSRRCRRSCARSRKTSASTCRRSSTASATRPRRRARRRAG